LQFLADCFCQDTEDEAAADHECLLIPHVDSALVLVVVAMGCVRTPRVEAAEDHGHLFIPHVDSALVLVVVPLRVPHSPQL